MKVEEIKEGLFKITFTKELSEKFPIYVKIDEKSNLRMTQPDTSKDFKEEDYFGKLIPNEIVVGWEDVKDFIDILTKLNLVQKL